MLARIRRSHHVAVETLLMAAKKYGRDRAGRMAAAIAYRTVFALAPLLIIAVSVVGAVLGSSEEAQEEIVATIQSVAGDQVATFFADFLGTALSAGDTAAVIGFALLFWFASSLFLEVQNDLNDIFEVPYERVSGLWATVRERGIGFLWALGLGLGVLVVLLINSLWRFFEDVFPENLGGLYRIVAIAAPLVSVVLLPLIFGLVLQTMTAVKVRWRAVWWGGLFTAVVFIAAAYGIGLYFRILGEPTALGFAGSVVVVLFLAYMLSAVFLYGATVTKLYSDRLDGRLGGRTAGSSPHTGIVVVDSPTPVPRIAFLAFLGGLLVGWKRWKR